MKSATVYDNAIFVLYFVRLIQIIVGFTHKMQKPNKRSGHGTGLKQM